MLTSTAGVWLKKIVGGSALRPSTFFGMIWLVSILASTRSRAITRSSSGSDTVISETTALTVSRWRVGKLDSTILKSEKLTSRSSTATLVADSSLIVPRAGSLAPFAGVGDSRVTPSRVSDRPRLRSAADRAGGRRHSVSRRRAATRHRAQPDPRWACADAAGVRCGVCAAAPARPTPDRWSEQADDREHRDAGLDASVDRGVLCSHAGALKLWL